MSAKLSAETLADSNDKLTMEIYRQSRISHTPAQARLKVMRFLSLKASLLVLICFRTGS